MLAREVVPAEAVEVAEVVVVVETLVELLRSLWPNVAEFGQGVQRTSLKRVRGTRLYQTLGVVDSWSRRISVDHEDV